MPLRKLLQAIMTALCIAAAVSFYWFWSAEQIRGGLADWRQQEEAKGRQVSYQEPQIEGFPFALELMLREPVIEEADRWRWSAPKIEARSWLHKPHEIAVDASGEHRLAFQRKGKTGQGFINLRRSNLALTLDNNGQIIAADLDLGGAYGTIDRELHFSIKDLLAKASLSETVETGPSPRIGLDLKAQEISLRGKPLHPLSNEITEVAFRGQLFGWQSQDWSPAALTQWREREGRLDIETLQLLWDGITVAASGELKLDEKLRPLGVLDAWWRGLSDTIDQLTAAKVLQAEAALALKFGLLALPSRTAEDGVTEVNLPVTFEDGQLFLGPVPVTRLRPLS